MRGAMQQWPNDWGPTCRVSPLQHLHMPWEQWISPWHRPSWERSTPSPPMRVRRVAYPLSTVLCKGFCLTRPPGFLLIRSYGAGHATLILRETGCSPGIQKLLPVETTKELDHLRHYAGPSRLVAGPEARAVVAVEVLVEQNVI